MDFATPQRAVECLISRLRKDEAEEGLLQAAESLINAAPQEAEAAIHTLLASDRWDCLSVGLQSACLALAPYADGPAPQWLRDLVLTNVEAHLEHTEPRVRKLIAQALWALCRTDCGVSTFVHLRPLLVSSIGRYMAKREQETMCTRYRGSEEIALDDVTGWKSLETSLLALVAMVQGCGAALSAQGHLDAAFLSLSVTRAAAHQNRYVREAGMRMCAALAEHCPSLLADPETVALLAQAVATGLRDAWPQVVYAASLAVRCLLLNHPSGPEVLFPLLLPRLCLNRYFVPEGVQVYSQSTWESLFGAKGGSAVVGQHMGDMTSVYTEASRDGASHFARIAACYAMAELFAKVEREAVLPQLDQLREAITRCLTDSHWEVRSAACVALRTLACHYGALLCPHAPALLPLCFTNLEDESWAIRADAAEALGALARHASSSDFEILPLLLDRLRKTLSIARTQPALTKEQAAKLFNDPARHTGQRIVGCCGGEPAQHTHTHTHAHGHKHHGHAPHQRRKAEAWEVADGAVYLLLEVLHDDLRSDDMLPDFMPQLADVASLQHFPQADSLRETVWSVLPVLCGRIGKRSTKRHVDPFLPQLLQTLADPSASPLARHAALQCMKALSALIGPSIFLGRLPAQYHDLYLSACTEAARGHIEGSRATHAFPELRNRPSLVSI